MSNYIEQRPWGSFEVLAEGNSYKVKKIIVNPGCRLSLQSHEKRDEIWTIVDGKIAFQGETKSIAGNTIIINKGMKHRATNIEKEPLVFIETQIGICDEDDITRYEDDYGRCLVHCSWCNNGKSLIAEKQSCPACNRSYKDKESSNE